MTTEEEWDQFKPETDQSRDRIAETFADKVILVTGATGFVGKVLVEKILRLHNPKRVYAIVRPKKGKSIEERFEQYFNDPLFEMMRKKRGDAFLKKVEFVSGDISTADLSLTKNDRKKLTDEVEYIMHLAATIRFDEDLKPAVILNVRGTKVMLDLAAECKTLKLFLYLSTAYCHLHERILYEKAYPPPTDPHNLIKTCEMLDNDVVNTLATKLLDGWPNSYAFTKSLAESLVNDQMGKLPVILLRPSMIMPVWLEPIPGWTDNINGPMGLLIAAGKGVLRTMFCDGSAYADYVPVDVVVNSLLACVMDQVVFRRTQCIYNITSSAEYKITFEEIINYGKKMVHNRIPLNGVFWYPGGGMTQSRLLHNLRFFFYQWVPAVIVDILLVCLGYPPVLKRVQRRILKGYDVFEYYTNRQWDFNNDRSMAARKLLTQKEKELYKLDGDGLQYEEYFYNCILSARRYILKESDESIPSAKRHMKVMYFADKVCKLLLVFAFFYFILAKFFF